MYRSNFDINVIRNIILESQHLLHKSTDSIESIISDICGLQYDPNPTITLELIYYALEQKEGFQSRSIRCCGI